MRKILLSILVLIPCTSNAACRDYQAQSDSECRYPTGDQWCKEKYPNSSYIYSYNDACIKGLRERTSSPDHTKSSNVAGRDNQTAKHYVDKTKSIISALLGKANEVLSSEPTDSDVSAAMYKMLHEGINQMHSNPETQEKAELYSASNLTFNSVKKLGCKQDGSNASICDIELELSSNVGNERSLVRYRFVRSSRGWEITDSVK